MAHIFFIDPLEKLNIKKDSSLMMALEFKNLGHEVYMLFEKDFYINNQNENKLVVYDFEGSFKEDGIYLESFSLTDKKMFSPSKKDFIHMRIDPPFDTRYLRYLWMLDFLEKMTSVKVLNNPRGIMIHNEKLAAYSLESSVDSYIGSSEEGFLNFIKHLNEISVDEIILKPLDLYSGIGVEKVSLNDSSLKDKFNAKVKEFHGAIIAQPFIKAVYEGEHRAIYYNAEELGVIIKRPNKGEYLSNIAQGAQFEKSELSPALRALCLKISKDLLDDGVNFIAFDILGNSITEINITCPGLLVEVSYANKKNLARTIGKLYL